MRMIYRASAVWAVPTMFMLLLGAGSCNRSAKDKATEDTMLLFPAEDEAHGDIKRLQDAILKGDAPAFASMVNYPLTRPYPLHDITDSVEMVKYFATMVDDTLRQHVRKLSPASWEPVGWRGWAMPGSGEYDTDMWFDGSVYEVPYVSRRERNMVDSLRNEEMQSLPSKMRQGGWTPVACVQTDDGLVYRIDMHKTPADTFVYRLSEYKFPLHPQTAPVRIIENGYINLEGSSSSKSYHFANKSVSADYDAEPADGAPFITVVANGDSNIRNVRPAYWLDLLKYNKNKSNKSN